MGRAKIAITLDEKALAKIDRLVSDGVYPNRSQAIQAAVDERLARLERSRLGREAARLDPAEEQALAEEGMTTDVEWPEY